MLLHVAKFEAVFVFLLSELRSEKEGNEGGFKHPPEDRPGEFTADTHCLGNLSLTKILNPPLPFQKTSWAEDTRKPGVVQNKADCWVHPRGGRQRDSILFCGQNTSRRFSCSEIGNSERPCKMALMCFELRPLCWKFARTSPSSVACLKSCAADPGSQGRCSQRARCGC